MVQGCWPWRQGLHRLPRPHRCRCRSRFRWRTECLRADEGHDPRRRGRRAGGGDEAEPGFRCIARQHAAHRGRAGRQRRGVAVGIAAAIIHKPALVLLDEPTSGLDPNQLVEIRNLIVRISKDAIVLFSTHILQEVSAICSSVLVLHKSKLVANTLINDLLKPTQPAVRVVFEEDIEAYLTDSFFQSLDFEKQDKHVLVIKSKDINKLKKEVLNFALAKGLNIQALQTQEASLEEIFKLLTH